MGIESDKRSYVLRRLDGGRVTRVPAHALRENQTPNGQNFDPSEEGACVKRAGYTTFTGSAKGTPTGSFVSGLFAATIAGAPAQEVWQEDNDGGPSYVDETTDFNDSDANDCDPFPAVEGVNDAFYIGVPNEFTEISINTGTAGVGGVVAWEYYNGSTWASLSGLTDDTTGFTATGAQAVTWTRPSDWSKTTVNSGASLYFVRARCTTVYSTNPIITQGSITSGRTYVLASEGTALHDITDTTWDNAITGATIDVDTPVRFLAFNDQIIVMGQGGGPYTFAGGSTVSALGGSPPSNARGGGVHKSRVWFYTNNSTITFSALNNEADYTTTDDAGTIVINKGDGNIINGFMSGGDFAVISKVSPSSDGTEGGLYIIFGDSPFDFSVRKIADVAATGQEGMHRYDNFVVVTTARGIYGIQGRNLFKLNEEVWPDYDSVTYKGTTAIGVKSTQIRIAFPSSGTANNVVMPLDVERGVWGYDTGKTPRQYAKHPDGRLLWGNSGASIIVYEDDNGTSDNGSAINFFWQTPDLDFEDPASPKRLSSSHIHADTANSSTLTVDRYTDGTAASENQTYDPSTASGPVKRFTHRDPTGKFQALRITNNATSSVKLYQIEMFAARYQPGTF